jgi:hypothetical protein
VQAAAHHAILGAHRLDSIVQHQQTRPGMLEKYLPGLGEGDLPGGAVHQLNAEFLFQLFDGDRKTGLDDVHAACGGGELSFFRQGYEMEKVPDFHERSPLFISFDDKSYAYVLFYS